MKKHEPREKGARLFGYFGFVFVCNFCVSKLELNTFFCTKGRSRYVIFAYFCIFLPNKLQKAFRNHQAQLRVSSISCKAELRRCQASAPRRRSAPKACHSPKARSTPSRSEQPGAFQQGPPFKKCPSRNEVKSTTYARCVLDWTRHTRKYKIGGYFMILRATQRNPRSESKKECAESHRGPNCTNQIMLDVWKTSLAKALICYKLHHKPFLAKALTWSCETKHLATSWVPRKGQPRYQDLRQKPPQRSADVFAVPRNVGQCRSCCCKRLGISLSTFHGNSKLMKEPHLHQRSHFGTSF